MSKIVIYPNEKLNQVCDDCDLNDPRLGKLSKTMAKLMYNNSGVGLAAPQIGENLRLVVVDCDYDIEDNSTRDPLVLINPEIVSLSGDFIDDTEGCLSCPGISVHIKRQQFATVTYYDLNGDKWEIEADGLLARCIQHEVDHLNGKTLFEACDPQEHLRALAAYQQALAAGAKPGQTTIK